MKVTVQVHVIRDDETTLSRTVTTETLKTYRAGNWSRETRAQVRQRVERLTQAALNATLGSSK